MAENSSSQNLKSDGEPPLLPRQAWNSQLAYLKAVLKAKQALDRREKSKILSANGATLPSDERRK